MAFKQALENVKAVYLMSGNLPSIATVVSVPKYPFFVPRDESPAFSFNLIIHCHRTHTNLAIFSRFFSSNLNKPHIFQLYYRLLNHVIDYDMLY